MVKLPNSLVAGETIVSAICHPTATAVALVLVGSQKHTAAFTQSGNEWRLSQPTAAWDAGAYAWQLWVDTPGGRSVAGSGTLVLQVSLEGIEAGTVIDNRNEAQRNLDAIDAMLAGKASAGVRRYRINNRELESYGIDELLKLREFWAGKVRAGKPRRRYPHMRVSF